MGSPWSHCRTQPLPPIRRLPPAWLPWKQLLLCHFCSSWHRRGESFHLVPEMPKEDWLPVCRISKLEQILKCLVVPDLLLMRNPSDWFMSLQWQRTVLCHHPLSQYLYQSLKHASWTISVGWPKSLLLTHDASESSCALNSVTLGTGEEHFSVLWRLFTTPFLSFSSLNNLFSLLLSF